MCRVLILDDDIYFAETIKLVLEDEEEANPEFVVKAEEALTKVTQAVGKNKPYEILLIDYRLGPEKDGIEVFKELRAISPDSDGIIFTGYEDAESGLLAYKAGAFRYLPKTANNQEILFVFRALRQFRKEQREHNWQQIFGEVMGASIREKDFHDVAYRIASYSLKLGFSRAHLFWTPTGHDANPQHRMLGIHSAGDGRVENFQNRLYPLGDWVGADFLHNFHSAVFLQSAAIERSRSIMESYGYQPPTGEIALLPLRSGERLMGLLMLDHGQTSKSLSDHERGLLDFYAKQVSLALEHAALYTKEQKTTQEQAAANRIGQEITAGATDRTPGEILEAVRGKLGAHFKIDNFEAILIDEETHELDFHLCYQRGELLPPARRPSGTGLEGWLLAGGVSRYISEDVAGFAQRNKIQLTGPAPASWLGVPLRVNGKVIGGVILQHFQPGLSFIDRDEHLLTLIADQVSGAIQNCRSAEKERQEMEKLNVLSRAGVEMLHVARENEENLWKTTLTIATANFGVGFNRAMLFLLAEQTSLIGRGAVGTEDNQKAIKDWQADDLRHYTFDDFLGDLRARKLKLTDFDPIVQKIEIPLRGRSDAFVQVLATGQPLLIDAGEVQTRLPKELTAKINLANCAVLPLPTSTKVEGILLVDNKHTGKPIHQHDLKRLQTVLNYAGLIWETLREREKSENLLYANQEIMHHLGREELKDTLARVCNAALGLSEADWIIIYPFLENRRGIQFDTENISYAGELKSTVGDVLTKQKPSPNGMTAYIIAHDGIHISDVAQPTAKISNKRIEDHQFISREGVKAMIGMSIRDAYSDEPLGVFYINFRETRQFSERDMRHAQSFASLAAFAISNARRMDEREQHRRLEVALETAESVNSGLGQEEMLKHVLEKLRKVFRDTTLCVLTYDDADHSLKFAPGALDFYKPTNPAYRRVHHFPLHKKPGSIACDVAQKALKSGEIEIVNIGYVYEHPDYLPLIVETQSELCASLVSSEKKLLGVLALERQEKFGFSKDDEALVDVVAQQLSMGLERFQQRAQDNFHRNVSTLTAWAADLAHEINNEAFKIQALAYLIKAKPGDLEAIQTYTDNLLESVQKLAQTAPRRTLGNVVLPLDATLKKHVDALSRKQNIEVEFLPEAEAVAINANQLQLYQVVRHLFRNAARAMSNRKHKKIIVQTRIHVTEKVVEILFQDFGPGVNEKVRPFIFQMPITTKDQKGEGGNGLLITRLLVEEMGGAIRLLPKEPGKGAVFSIKLPIAEPKSAGDK